MASAGGFKSSDEHRRQKELEKARQAGIAPAARDEDGKEINPHIPNYMTSAPWYLNKDQPTLTHQKNWKEKKGDGKQWYDRGTKVFQATKYRKGACENCGSMSHVTKDCLERPRARGAKWTNKNIAADDKIETIEFDGWETKRDRWNGFDAKDYERVVERFELREKLREEIRKKEQLEKNYAEVGADAEVADGGGDAEETKIQDDQAAVITKVEKRVNTVEGGNTGSVRNLRIREDTAKYLLNLDVNSAHYDPKSRSMREDPNPDKPLSEKTFAGDNFVRQSGDYAAWNALNLYSTQAAERGAELHMVAVPSAAEQLHAQFRAKKALLAQRGAAEVLEKYGQAAEKPPEELALLAGSERYVEYDRAGRVVKGIEAKVRSRYEEDVFPGNHTSVWGSWWADGSWGYACCHSCVKGSYCVGASGREAAVQQAAQMAANMEAKAREAEAEELKKREASKLTGYTGVGGAANWGSDAAADAPLDASKLAAALEKQAARDAAAAAAATDDRKRRYNSLANADEELTAEDMEAFRLKRGRADDPMTKLQTQGGSGTGGYDLL